MTGAQMVASGMNCTLLDPSDTRCRIGSAPVLTYSMGGKYKAGNRTRYGAVNVY
jgi:hypothetical protein